MASVLTIYRLLKAEGGRRQRLGIETARRSAQHEMSMNIMQRHARASEHILPHQECDTDDCSNYAYETRMIGPVPFAFCHECLGTDSG